MIKDSCKDLIIFNPNRRNSGCSRFCGIEFKGLQPEEGAEISFQMEIWWHDNLELFDEIKKYFKQKGHTKKGSLGAPKKDYYWNFHNKCMEINSYGFLWEICDFDVWVSKIS